MDSLIAPHGGALRPLLASPERAAQLRAATPELPALSLTERQVCDLELLLNGGFSPLPGFLGRRDYQAVLEQLRLVDGTVWPMPVMLSVTRATAERLHPGQGLVLCEGQGVPLAVLWVEDVWEHDPREEAEAVFGTADPAHPGVRHLLEEEGPAYVGGRVEGIELPPRYDYPALRRTPAALRADFQARGWRRVVGFQTRNPLHRAHQEMSWRAAESVDANLLLHPVVGLTKPGDIDHQTRVRCYQAITHHYPPGRMALALLPLAMRMAGPREALWHALVRKNHGCSHFIIGRDHAGPGADRSGQPFYGPYEAQELVQGFQDEIGVAVVPFQEMVYVPRAAAYRPVNEVGADETVWRISGTELRRRLRSGEEVPDWFSYPEVIAELRRSHPPRHRQGIVLFFTGLSGAGKSTLAGILAARLSERGERPVTLLDGDIVRRNLSSELGFSREHRDLNILRIGFVANEIARNGGIAICAPIAPYAATRERVRERVSASGAFVEIHVATPLAVCEARDRKGLYAKARAGQIAHFTGISDPYEAPEHPELRIDTSTLTAQEGAAAVLDWLRREGYLAADA